MGAQGSFLFRAQMFSAQLNPKVLLEMHAVQAAGSHRAEGDAERKICI